MNEIVIFVDFAWFTVKPDNQLDFIRKKITHVNTKTAIKMAYNTATNGLEALAPFVGLDLQGLTEETNRSKDIDSILSELSCEYSIDKYLDPKIRLVAYTGFAVLRIDSQNKQNRIRAHHKEETKDDLDELISEDIKKKYSDI